MAGVTELEVLGIVCFAALKSWVTPNHKPDILANVAQPFNNDEGRMYGELWV